MQTINVGEHVPLNALHIMDNGDGTLSVFTSVDALPNHLADELASNALHHAGRGLIAGPESAPAEREPVPGPIEAPAVVAIQALDQKPAALTLWQRIKSWMSA